MAYAKLKYRFFKYKCLRPLIGCMSVIKQQFTHFLQLTFYNVKSRIPSVNREQIASSKMNVSHGKHTICQIVVEHRGNYSCLHGTFDIYTL